MADVTDSNTHSTEIEVNSEAEMKAGPTIDSTSQGRKRRLSMPADGAIEGVGRKKFHKSKPAEAEDDEATPPQLNDLADEILLEILKKVGSIGLCVLSK